MNNIASGRNYNDPFFNPRDRILGPAESNPPVDAGNNLLSGQPIDTILSQAVPLFPIDSLKDAKQAWATLAYTTVKQCFKKEYGKITIDKSRVEEIIKFWQENPDPPEGFKNIPGWKLVRTQTLSVLKVVKADMDNVTAEDIVGMTQYGKGDSLVEILMRASQSDCTAHGKQMLESMSSPGQDLIKPHEAILASLLTPHRQRALPSCTLDSLINEETCNHPAALARIFLNLLETDAMPLISCGVNGRLALPNLTIISPGSDDSREHYIIITPKLSWGNPDNVYRIKNGNDVDLDNLTNEEKMSIIEEIPRSQRARFEAEGIEVQPYIVGEPQTSPLGLKYPVHNLTDVLFANMMQSVCGNSELIETAEVLHLSYYGRPPWEPAKRLYSPLDPSNYELSKDQLQWLQDVASDLREEDPNRQLVAICTDEPEDDLCHDQNLYLDDLEEVPIDGPDPDKYYIIGDRNFTDNKGKSKFLAVKKVEGKEDTWEFIEVTEPDQTEILHFTSIGWVE